MIEMLATASLKKLARLRGYNIRHYRGGQIRFFEDVSATILVDTTSFNLMFYKLLAP